MQYDNEFNLNQLADSRSGVHPSSSDHPHFYTQPEAHSSYSVGAVIQLLDSVQIKDWSPPIPHPPNTHNAYLFIP